MKTGDHEAWDAKYEAHKHNLNERERFVWEHRRQGLSLEKIGKLIGITREHVRQAENKAKRKIMFYAYRAENPPPRE